MKFVNNEIDQSRGEYLKNKAIVENSKYEDPYHIMMRKMKKTTEILLEKITESWDKIIGLDEKLPASTIINQTNNINQSLQTENIKNVESFTQTLENKSILKSRMGMVKEK